MTFAYYLSRLICFTGSLLGITYLLQATPVGARLPPYWWGILLLFGTQAGIAAGCRTLEAAKRPLGYLVVAFLLRVGTFCAICYTICHHPPPCLGTSLLYVGACYLLFLSFDLYLALKDPVKNYSQPVKP